MKKVIVFTIIVVFSSCTAVLADFIGSLDTGSGGLVGNGGGYSTGSSTFSWVVTPPSGGNNLWHYDYTLTVPTNNISHLIIETSPTFTASDISNVHAVQGGFDTTLNIGTWGSQGNSNPGIPSSAYGIKFNQTAGVTATTWELSFDSDRAPVWGDFYTKDGAPGGALWNAGFTSPDSDPSVGPSNGSVSNSILRPDTTATTVPVPGAILLGGIGVTIVGWLRKRRTI